MKILLDINDNKVSQFMEILKSLTFVNTATPISTAKAELINEIREAVNELNLINEGKLKARDARELLNEL